MGIPNIMIESDSFQDLQDFTSLDVSPGEQFRTENWFAKLYSVTEMYSVYFKRNRTFVYQNGPLGSTVCMHA